MERNELQTTHENSYLDSNRIFNKNIDCENQVSIEYMNYIILLVYIHHS